MNGETELIQSMSSAFSASVGVLVFVGLFFFVQRMKLRRWEWFARRFGVRQLPEKRASKSFGTLLISDVPRRELWATGYHKYPPVQVAIHDEGVSFTIWKPFGYGACPILLPFDGLVIEPTTWGDMPGKIVAISHQRLHDAYIIAYQDIADWIRANAPLHEFPDYRSAAHGCT